MTKASTYSLRLPRSLKAAVKKIAKAEGINLNRFVATAEAEKLSAMNVANTTLPNQSGRRLH